MSIQKLALSALTITDIQLSVKSPHMLTLIKNEIYVDISKSGAFSGLSSETLWRMNNRAYQ